MKMKKLVCGVGINDADYDVVAHKYIFVDGKRRRKIVWRCPFYQAWAGMLERGYNEKYKLRQPTYKDVTVCEEWLIFSVFKTWMEKQYHEGQQLDKDILIQGNKVYSPETCVFVSRQVNNFLLDREASRGKYRIGACLHKASGKFMAQCSNPFTAKKDHLGYFISEDDAHNAWLTKKLEHAKALAATQTDERVAKALIARYENYKEIIKEFA
jgi:hypothetical protein